MPRRADERDFGFRKEGLLRILVGADAEQVLLAVEELGFTLPDRVPIDTLAGLLNELTVTTDNIVFGFIVEIFERLEELWITVLGGREIQDFELAVFERSMRQLRARRLQIQLDYFAKKEESRLRVAEIFFKIGTI